MKRKISVVIPTYNRQALILNAIRSVLAQARPADEIIVVDDGSTDETRAVLESFSPPGSKTLIRNVYLNHGGQSKAFNKGVELAAGDWIAFLASDDTWHSEKLEWQSRAIDQFKEKCDACFTDAKYVNNPQVSTTAFRRSRHNYDDQIGILSKPAKIVARGLHGLLVQTLLMRKSLFQSCGGFDENLFLYEDADLVFRMSLHADFCYVNDPLVDVDRTPDRIVGMVELTRNALVRLQQKEILYKKWLGVVNRRRPDLRPVVADRLASTYCEWASVCLQCEDQTGAKRSIDTAARLRLHPIIALKWGLIHAFPRLTTRLVRWKRERANRKAEIPL